MRFDGNQPIGNVVAKLNLASDFLGGMGRCTVKSVVVRAPDQWFNHVTVISVRLADDMPAGQDVMELSGATLFMLQRDLDREISVDEFQALATHWQKVVQLPTSRELQEQTTVFRCPSDAREASRWPRWDCRLHERPSSNGPSYASPGPYRHKARNFFALDLPDLTVQWFGSQEWANQANVLQEYRVMFEDRRGRLTGVTASDNGLLVSVNTLNDEARCCAVRTKSPSGTAGACHQDIAGGKALIPIDVRDKERFEVLLTGDDGETLDRYDESPGWASWGPENAVLRQTASALSVSAIVMPMDDDELELALAERFLAQHRAGELEDPQRGRKCVRELDLRKLLGELTGEDGASLDYNTDTWLRRLTSPRMDGPAPLRKCSDGAKNSGEHRFHLRAYFDESGLPAADWLTKLRRLTKGTGGGGVTRRGTHRAPSIAGSDLWDVLHPAIAGVARERFESGQFADAVEAALKEINQSVKTRVLAVTGQEYDGSDLMNRAFSLDRPVVTLADLSTQSGRDEQVGYMQLFSGAMRGIRNPKAHANLQIDDVRATHLLFLSSLLMSKLGEAR